MKTENLIVELQQKNLQLTDLVHVYLNAIIKICALIYSIVFVLDNYDIN